MTHAPSMPRGRDIICISSIDWDFIWQGHQQIMSMLAAGGNRVLFIENTGVRSPGVGDVGRVRSRLRNWWRGTKGFRQERDRLFVYSPLVLPFPYGRAARWVNVLLLRRALRRWMRATGFGRPIVWTFLPTPLVRALIRDLDPALTIYYCIDDFAASSGKARRIRKSEAEMFREADLVFVTSEKLRQRAAESSDHVHLFPFGVDFPHFARVLASPDSIPKELVSLPHPVAGYVGGLHQWIDQDLLVAVAEALPETSFVLIGPPQDDVSRLAARPNVHLLGPRAHADVPRYIKGFDVGLIPYRLSEYTTNVYPTKLNEYLAMGTPVVATDLPEIRRFNAEYGDIVAVAGEPHGFADAIRSVTADTSDASRTRRIAVARENGWDERVDSMSALIERALTKRDAGEARGWERTLRGLYRTARRRMAAAVVAAACLYVLLSHTPAVWLVAAPLRVAEAPRAADAIVVFAGGVGESGEAGGGYQERVRQAIDLYRAGHASRIIFSSGFAFAFNEAEVMRDLAISQGVPASAIVLETKAANTHENVVFVNRVLENRGWRRILLISSPYHMRRALLVWRKAAPGIAVVATPVAQSQFYRRDRLGATPVQMGGILYEYAAIAAYWWRGWI